MFVHIGKCSVTGKHFIADKANQRVKGLQINYLSIYLIL